VNKIAKAASLLVNNFRFKFKVKKCKFKLVKKKRSVNQQWLCD